MTDVHIRVAATGDLPYLPDIELAAARLFPEGRLPAPEETCPEQLLVESLESGLLFVAECESALAGFAVATIIGAYLHLEEVSVRPSFGQKGIGAALVQRVIEESVHRNLDGVTLTTFLDIRWNAPFYRKMGFVDLDPAELPTHLRTHLEQEAQSGLTARVGMRYMQP